MKKLLIGLFVLFFIGVIGSVVSIKASGGFFSNLVDLSDRQVIINKDIKNVDINFSSSDIIVIPSDDENFIFEVNGKVSKKLKDNYKLDISDNGDSLKVKFRKPNTYFHMGITMMDTTVTVYLPEKEYDNVKIHSSSGKIDTEGVNANELEISASSGNIFIDGVQADDIEISATSGNVATENVKTDKIDVSATSGNIKIKDQIANESYFKASSGHMFLTNVFGNINAKNLSGDINITNEESTGNIHAKASSGDVEVEYLNTPSSLYIDFNSSSGRGRIDIDGINYEKKENDRIIGTIGSGDYELQVNISSGNFSLQ
ncbi:DUF4097 family beta strand repeat-containing protein [Bacillus solimangrovi]|uniref:DUF4097 domain-containing protein n=1 Tax=Bacillus solimangrovi TaxID=1305675 RepID=A0A1E5LF12_9BACI|nr:DUF4097 family beta strand repeat-containing protein [Bacillus solimangrovi]OEH92667.1 hypothetical protein BFG57_01285 [Bacillus solimangrovi]